MGLWSVTALLALLFVVLGWAARSTNTGPRVLRGGHVTAISGAKGAGKTLFLVHEMLRAAGRPYPCKVCLTHAEAVKGRPLSRRAARRLSHPLTVAANFDVRLPDELGRWFRRIHVWQDCFDLPHNTLVIMDEVDGLSPADVTYTLPTDVWMYIKQARKYGHEILWSAQNEDRVTVKLRKLTDWVGFVRAGVFRTRRVYFTEYDNGEKLRKSLLSGAMRGKNSFRAQWSYTYRVRRDLRMAYNSHALVSFEVPGESVDAARHELGDTPPPLSIPLAGWSMNENDGRPAADTTGLPLAGGLSSREHHPN